MCGIAGIFWQGEGPGSQGAVAKALEAMRRRGPDDRGTESIAIAGGGLVLGHTRLSVIDLSPGGHQPKHAAGLSLVFNGEIYNYLELRRELQAEGVAFYTGSDTEVLLQAWARWGEACLPRLAGMFAFALYDHAARTLTCVRDAFGIKPFFYTQDATRFCFASELPAMKALRGGAWSLNLQLAYDYLMYGEYDSTQESFVDGVLHLMPGHLLQVKLGEAPAPARRWWTPRVSPVSTLAFADAADALREQILQSVRLHLRSDVALGAALSGGLDSSTIVCAMRHIEPELPIHTFTYVARGTSDSEEAWADRINAGVGAHAHKVEVTAEELARDLDDMILAQGEPFGSTSIYAQYRVFQLARQHGVTVTLDGQGADELLAGYNGYPGKRVRSLLDEHRYSEAGRFLHEWSAWPGRRLFHGVKAGIAELVVDGPFYEPLRRLHGDRQQAAWIDTGALREQGVVLRYPRQRSPWEEPGRRLAAELAHAATQRGLPALLRHGDRNSMRFSVESRVPFLTTQLADFLLTLPEDYLISPAGETKRILRAAMRGIVPDEVLDRRDKIGFSTPEFAWLRQMAPQVRAWLQEDTGLSFLRRPAMLAEFDAVMAGKHRFSWQVWRWINFTRWHAHLFGG
jgi:asparagine synthase (glutamine-hydrolysing)